MDYNVFVVILAFVVGGRLSFSAEVILVLNSWVSVLLTTDLLQNITTASVCTAIHVCLLAHSGVVGSRTRYFLLLNVLRI